MVPHSHYLESLFNNMGRKRRKTSAEVLVSAGGRISHVPQATSPPNETDKARKARLRRNKQVVEDEKSRLLASMHGHSLIGITAAPPSSRPFGIDREIVVSGRMAVVQEALPTHAESNDERHAREARNQEVVEAEERRLEALALEIIEGKKVDQQSHVQRPPRPPPVIADGTVLADARRRYIRDLSSERYHDLLEQGRSACSDDSDSDNDDRDIVGPSSIIASRDDGGADKAGRDDRDESDDGGLFVYDNDEIAGWHDCDESDDGSFANEQYGWRDVTYKPMPASDVESMLYEDARRLDKEGVWQWVPEDGSYHCIVPTFNHYELLSAMDPDGEDGGQGDPLEKSAALRAKKRRGRPAVRTLPFEDVPQWTPHGTSAAPIRVCLDVTPDNEDPVSRKKRKQRNSTKLRNAGKAVRGRKKKRTPAIASFTSPTHGTRQANVTLDTTPLEESPKSRNARRDRNRRKSNLTQRSLLDELQQAGAREQDKARTKKKEDSRRSRMQEDPSLASARRQQNNERDRRRRAKQPTTDQQRLDQMYAAQASMLRCKQTEEYKQHRERHLAFAKRNRDERVPGFGNGKNRTTFQKEVWEAFQRGQQRENQRRTGIERFMRPNDWTEEPWESITQFHKDLKAIKQPTCRICNERWPGMEMRRVEPDVCMRCHTDKGNCKKFSAENDMDPEVELARDNEGPLPELSDVEEALIARASEVVTYYRLPHGSTGYRGHVCFLPQNINGFLDQLPRRVEELDWIIVRREGCTPGKHKDFKVRREAVMRWLRFLKRNNEAYKDIRLDDDAAERLPEDDYVGDRLPSMMENDMEEPEQGPAGTGVRLSQQTAGATSGSPQDSDGDEDDEDYEPSSTSTASDSDSESLSTPRDDEDGGADNEDAEDIAPQDSGAISCDQTASEQQALSAALEAARDGCKGPECEGVNAGKPMAWPDIEQDNPINEYTEQYLMTCTFPTLFPTGKAQLRAPRRVDIKPQEYFLHFLRHKSGKFQRHKRYRYTALNCDARWRARDVAGVYVKKRLKDISVEQLYERVQNNNLDALNGLLRWSQTLRGTRQYWAAVRAKAYSWLTFLEYYYDQMPTLFYTMSAAEMHWDWLHKLFDESEEYMNAEDMEERLQKKLRGEAVVANPGKVAWAFVEFCNKWHCDVLYKVKGWAEHFLRYEFAQNRGMTHAHCLGLIFGAPSISQIEIALEEVAENHEGGEEAQKIFKWVEENIHLIALHPEPDSEEWPPPEGRNEGPPPINHLRLGFDEIGNTYEDVVHDIIMLVNRVNLHNHSKYCEKKVTDENGQERIICRFQYGDKDFMRTCNCECHNEELRNKTAKTTLDGKRPTRCPPPCFRSDMSEEEYKELMKHKCPGCVWRIQLDKREKYALLAPRNHGRLVAYMAWFLAGVRANVDAQYILDQGALINYILKYQTKAEKKSALFQRMFKDLVSEAMKELRKDSGAAVTVTSIMRKCLNKTIGDRDYSSVETCHMLQGIELWNCSRAFKPCRTDGDVMVKYREKDIPDDERGEGEGEEMSKAHDDVYKMRPRELEEKSFYEYFAEHDDKGLPINGPWVVPTIKPWCNPSPHGEKYPAYCRQQLMVFKPWRQSPEHILASMDIPPIQADGFQPTLTLDMLGDDGDFAWVKAFEWWVQSGEAPPNVQREHKREMDRAIDDLERLIEKENEEMDRDSVEQSEGSDYSIDAEECDDEAMLFRRNPNFRNPNDNGDLSQEDDYDWANAIPEEWRDLDFSRIDKWLEDTKANNLIDMDLSNWWGDIEYHTLFDKQKLAVALVKSYISEGSKRGQLLMHLMGTAGTGKTHTVKAICKMAAEEMEGQGGKNLILAAPTGTAAFLIKGQTLHRALKLPTVDPTKMNDLSGADKATLEQEWKNVKLLIIDEQSMVGRRMLGQINRRLKQIKGNDQLPFGGVHVILVGDNGQLPPVKDKPKFDMSIDSKTILHDDAVAAVACYEYFKTVVRLDVAARQSETDEFYALLQRIREGEIRDSDWEFLKQRNLQSLPREEQAQFKDAIRLMSTKRSVEEFNLDRVQRCPGKVARLKAEHNKPEAQDKNADDFQGLKREFTAVPQATPNEILAVHNP